MQDHDHYVFRRIQGDESIHDAAALLRRAFGTVADDLGFTEETAPTNAAFITPERLATALSGGVALYGLYDGANLLGTVGIERSPDNATVYFVERLAVDPSHRHRGLGKLLMDHAIAMIRDAGGRTASIGIINENIRLKQWYAAYGFLETETKTYPHLPFTVCFMNMLLQS